MINRLLILVLALALVATPAFAREGKYRNTGTLGLWSTELYGSANIEGQAFNLKGNGNFDNETAVDFEWKWKVGKLSDVQIIYHGIENSGIINKAIKIGGVTYNANAKVDMELSTVDLLGFRELTKGEQGWLDFVYGLKFMNFDVTAAGVNNLTGLAASTSKSFSFPLPQFGLAGEYYMNPRWTAYGSFYGFTLNRDDKGGTVKTLDAGFQYRFNPKHDAKTEKVDWYAQLGWKAQYLRGKDGVDEIIIDHEGPRFVFVGKF